MRTFLSLTILLILAASAWSEDLALQVRPPSAPIRLGDYTQFSVLITNEGPAPVTLVSPGDGSNFHWRTPKVGWSAIPMTDAREEHPDDTPVYRGGRCGNINPIKLDEVFTLAPGESRELGEWVAPPQFLEAGEHRLVFYYENVPGASVDGLPLGDHDRGVLSKMRKSHPCKLRSKEIRVVVHPKAEA